MTYDDLLIEAEDKGIKVKEKKLDYNLKGLYKNNKIIIDSNLLTDIEKKCILCEEIGHHETSFGNIIDDTDIMSQKQEVRARRWGIEHTVDLIKIINAFEYGCSSRFEMASYLGVTEDYLDAAIENYRKRYGLFFEVDKYVIYFEPYLKIIKKFNIVK